MDHRIYDAVHGFIRFNDLERELIDSEPFQRLHQIHQLGISFLVYPGATHTRFEHSLGAMELCTRIFDRLALKEKAIPTPDYWRQILRFAALCHDLGHLPFSHDAEDVLLGEGGHERWTLQVINSRYCAPIWAKMKELFPERDIASDVAKMSIGEEKLRQMGESIDFSNWEKVLCQIITGDFFGADRIDYLLRDAQCTGVSYGLFDYHQLIEMLCILPTENGLELGIEENGIVSCEALLLARHFMHQRVYQYASVVGYKFHLARFMKRFYAKSNSLSSLEAYLSLSDSEILSALRAAKEDPDATALLKRGKKFRAVEIKEESAEKSELGLSFPVLTRIQGVTSASELSDIRIPKTALTWEFSDPEEQKC